MDDIDKLVADGWKEYKTGEPNKRSWFKSFGGKYDCVCNDKVPDITLTLFELHHAGMDYSGWTAELRAEPNQGAWIDFQCYSMNDLSNLDIEIKKLYAAWNAINEL